MAFRGLKGYKGFRVEDSWGLAATFHWGYSRTSDPPSWTHINCPGHGCFLVYPGPGIPHPEHASLLYKFKP